jgi:hypothetical protein
LKRIHWHIFRIRRTLLSGTQKGSLNDFSISISIGEELDLRSHYFQDHRGAEVGRLPMGMPAIYSRAFLASSAISLVYCLLILSGCAETSTRTHADFQTEVRRIAATVIVPVEITVYEEPAGCPAQISVQWCDIAKKNLIEALVKGLKRKKYDVRVAEVEDSGNSELKQIQNLYRAVNKSIQLHTYGPQIFPGKVSRFEYSVGPTDAFLREAKADAIMLLSGLERIKPDGHKSYVSLGVAGPSGDIIWYDMGSSHGEYDLRDPAGAEFLVYSLLASFPNSGG